MHLDPRSVRPGPGAQPADLSRLGDPLDLIAEEHRLDREIFASLDAFAERGVIATEEAERVLSFLGEGLGTHLGDEHEDLFPLLRRRCVPEDEIDRILERLAREHAEACDELPEVRRILDEAAASEGPLTPEASAMLAAFARHARRRLILETAIVLPIARLRLTEADRETLRLRMLRRRGLDRLMDAADAD